MKFLQPFKSHFSKNNTLDTQERLYKLSILKTILVI